LKYLNKSVYVFIVFYIFYEVATMSGSGKSQDLKFSTNRTFICSVLFLDIVEYSKKPVLEQIKLKQRFNELLAESLKDIPAGDRIILDTGDGASVGFLSDPEDALFVALSLQASLKNEQETSMPDLLVRLGINLGPVKIIKDINNQYNLIGDGINISQRIMSFSDPGQLLVSRSYFDVVSCLSQEYAQLFQYKGMRADKHIREHDIYSVEHTGPQSMFVHHHAEPKADRSSEDTEGKDTNAASPVRKTLLEENLSSFFNFILEWTKKNTKLAAAIGVIFIVIIALIIFIPKTKYKSSSSKKSARATQSNTDAQGESIMDSIKTTSAKAEDISFTITNAKSSGSGAIITIRIRNESSTAKSVALYDDYVKWPKSKIADQSGALFEVSSVTFSKGSQRITAQAAGTQGLLINPKESVTASMTFKKTGKGIKTLNIHPFIYQGSSWKEHDLAMKIGG
jgi:class 3 adenylate cyclase